jgi:hypothetical protein
MFKQLILAIIVLLTALSAVSADFYMSTSGANMVGNGGSFRVSGRGVYAGGMVTPDGGIYAGANTTLRTGGFRGETFRTTDGKYAGSAAGGSRIYVPTYYHGGEYYGGAYAPAARVYGYGSATGTPSQVGFGSSPGYVSTTSYRHSRY